MEEVLTLQQVYRRGWTPDLIRKMFGDEPSDELVFRMKDAVMLESVPCVCKWFRRWKRFAK